MSTIDVITHADSVAHRHYCPGCKCNHTIYVEGTGRPIWHYTGPITSPTYSPSVLHRNGHYVPGHKEGEPCWCGFEERFGRPSPFSCIICHYFIRNGKIEYLGDCTHEYAGKTIDLPEIPKKVIEEAEEE